MVYLCGGINILALMNQSLRTQSIQQFEFLLY